MLGNMRELLPKPNDDVDLHAYYAADWLEPGGIRANMIVSVDGGAAAGGLTKGLQTPGDNVVYATLRDLADVVLVGSTTAEAENYRPVRLGDAQVARRRDLGLSTDVPIAVVSRSLRIDTSADLFTGSRPIVVTCAASDPDARAALSEHALVLVCGEHDIDYAEVRRQFDDRGLSRVLCEGGPTILARVMAAGELDELCLTVAPMAVGPGEVRIVAGIPWPTGPVPLELTGLLEEDGALFLRMRAAGT